ncbi:MAG: hypothetical protein AAF581_08380 [Planctomycetota bacterium]
MRDPAPSTTSWFRAGALLALMLLVAVPAPGAVAAPPLDPLAPYLGRPLVVEFPKIDDLGDLLEVPNGWSFLQADADSIDPLRARLQLPLAVGVVYIDRFGNVLHVDNAGNRRQRVARGVREFQRKQTELVARLDELRAAAQSAADRGRPGKELDRLEALLEIGVVGYPAVRAARQRWQALDAQMWNRLLDLLAREGVLSRRAMQQELRALQKEASSLPVAKRLRHELRRLKAGLIVRDQSS